MSTDEGAGDQLGRSRIEQRIGAALGVVVVDLWGSLLEVRLDRAGLHVADPGTVGGQILHAVRAAEQLAERAVAEYAHFWS